MSILAYITTTHVVYLFTIEYRLTINTQQVLFINIQLTMNMLFILSKYVILLYLTDVFTKH